MGKSYGYKYSNHGQSAFGGQNAHTADQTINRLMHKTLEVMNPWKNDTPHLISHMFKGETLTHLRQAYDMVNQETRNTVRSLTPSYNIGGVRGSLSIYRMAGTYQILPPQPELLDVTPTLLEPLREWSNTSWEIIKQFNEVRHVMHWMNRHATLGAVRYYWPSCVALFPSGAVPELLQGTPKSYKEPDGIAPLLPLIRKTMGTIASARLLPDGNEEKGVFDAVTMTFRAETIMAEGGIEILTETCHANLIALKE